MILHKTSQKKSSLKQTFEINAKQMNIHGSV